MKVQLVSESVSINCAFLNVLKMTPKSCNATITYGLNCEEQMLLYGIRDSENDSLIVISLRSFLEETLPSEYCGFRINATANSRTVTVDGNLLGKLHCDTNLLLTLLRVVFYNAAILSFMSSSPSNNHDVTAGVVTALVAILVIIIAAFMVVIIKLLRDIANLKQVINELTEQDLRNSKTDGKELATGSGDDKASNVKTNENIADSKKHINLI